jgi:PAS domain S-box-containing protein
MKRKVGEAAIPGRAAISGLDFDAPGFVEAHPTLLHTVEGNGSDRGATMPDSSEHLPMMEALDTAIIASSNDAILAKTLDGTILSWNPAAERLFGYTAEEMLDHNVGVLFPDDRHEELVSILERLAAGEHIERLQTMRRHKDGHLIDVTVVISPIHDRSGQVVAASAITRDITAYKRSEELFDLTVRAALDTRLSTEEALRRALDSDELFVLHYQPVINLADDTTAGFEGLLRWEHPELGTLRPSEFIHLAEQTGLIDAVGTWVLEHACAQLASWHRELEGASDLQMSVNVSPHQLHNPSFPATVTRALANAGLAPQDLVLEITETVLIDDIAPVIETLHRLAHLGVHLAIDDFGTGYASLTYLKQLPADILKIDQTFTASIDSDPRDEAIVSGILTTANALGITVVAEGVETPTQLDQLRTLGCHYAQGYLFSRPQPPHNLDSFLHSHRLPPQNREQRRISPCDARST